MKFCDDHWERLRAAIDDRGLGDLVAQSGERAERNLASEIEQGVSLVNFDPLMSAHWAIVSNAMATIGRAGASPVYLMAGEDVPEDPIDPTQVSHPDRVRGRSWPRCPLCYLNVAHELTCTDSRCELDEVGGYDWMIDRAADEAKTKADALRTAG